jgi:glycerophosphoryl diester phosphodiesterase
MLARTLRATLLVAPLLGFTLVSPGGAPAYAAPVKPCDAVTLTSHQGSKVAGDGNTIAAFEGAIKKGAEAIETDVQPTADGVFVMFHNATVDGLTTGTGPLDEMTYAQLSELRTVPKGLPIPTLDETLRLAKDRGVKVQLELKSVQNWAPGQVQQVVDLVAGYGLRDQVTLYSRHIPSVRRIHRDFPDSIDGWKSPHWPTFDPEFAATFADGMVAKLKWYTKANMDRAHALGLRVYSAKLKDETMYAAAVDAGVDSVLVLSTARYVKWCAAQPTP